MKIALLKKLNEEMPYWMKKPFAKIIRNKLISNPVFLAQYKELQCWDQLSSAEQNEYQLQLLRNCLEHAYSHTVYYRQLFNSVGFIPSQIKSVNDLKRIPVLTKKILKANYTDLQADDVSNSYLVTTGGTTGKPTKVQMARDAIYKEWAFVYHYWSKSGYDYCESRLATFRGVNLDGKISEINPLYTEIRLNPFLMNENNFENYLSDIEKFNANFIYGYPSAVYNFCRIANKKGINLSNRFRAALLISENLYPFQKKMIEDVLEAPIAMFYGHSERAVFGEQSENGYTFHKLYGVTEIDENGSLIVTGFINDKMPLVRYVVDDEIKTNPYGLFDIIGHRDCEVLYGENGEQISTAAINFHDDTFDGIDAYQFVQNIVGECEVHIVADHLLDKKKIELICDRVSGKLGTAIRCNVCQVNQISLSSRGKYRLLIQNCKVPEEKSNE